MLYALNNTSGIDMECAHEIIPAASFPAMRSARMPPLNTRARPDRRWFIGGSDARVIMGSDEAALLRLWHEKRGEAEPEDLSDNLIVQLGMVTEPLNRLLVEGIGRDGDFRPFAPPARGREKILALR